MDDQLDIFGSQNASDPVRDARNEFTRLRQALAERVLGREELLDVLALTALIHRHHLAPQRLLLSGPTGAGKSHIARALAEVTESRCHFFDVQQLTETGYRGQNLEHLLAAIYRASACDLNRVRTCVLVLDEWDKLRIGPEVVGVSADKRSGAMSSLLPLLGVGTPVSFETFGEEGDTQMLSDRMLIICCGAFSGAPWSRSRAPTTGDLIAWGILPELAERLTERLAVPAATVEELTGLYRHGDIGGLSGQAALFQRLGYSLDIPESTYHFVAMRVTGSTSALGPRSGAGLLVEAAKRVLARAIRRGIPPGSALTITPDDVSIVSDRRR